MSTRRLVLALGAAALLIGLIALLIPVSAPDGNGGSISCGTGLASDMSAAQEANNRSIANVPILNEVVPHTDYVAQCQSELSGRRSWAIPVAALGAVVAGASMLVGSGQRTGVNRGR